ncbi:hypothetical protein Tsubulata_017717 [Turnera subulata]|uniref:DUF7755 domain-containing protein n=1 Tax=Turnera subulata TaxID=218843 RepID=A0A9Q0GEN1_9ROSI|nr:hypothetical protein Tsubulata_017717 [Turnera subulata]
MESVSLRGALPFAATNLYSSIKIIPKHPSKHQTVAPPSRGSKRFRLYFKNRKQSDFRGNISDFQDYAEPLRLLPAAEPQVSGETSQEKLCRNLSLGKSRSLFKVTLQTSNAYGSSLSDLNGVVCLCLIDTNGDTVLQRILSVGDESLHFQTGGVDEFIFEGPKFGKLEAIWIGVQAGQWRLGNVSLIVVSACDSTEGNDGDKIYRSSAYEFEVDDVLVGRGSDTSLVELRPCLVTESSGTDPLALFGKKAFQSRPSPGGRISKEESMKEYEDLKISLLSYDALLIVAGTLISKFSAGENTAVAFFAGGVGGFLYLLLLQKYVDELPSSPSNSSASGGISGVIRGVKGPISILALAIGATLLAAKYNYGLTPRELAVGVAGFFACKVAVLLAAFKPIKLEFKEK